MSDGSSLFDIIGPIMVGPSSSHTAGAVRLAVMARMLAAEPIVHADLILFNSFAQTYQGHGTDRGLVGGLMGMDVDDPHIKDALDRAKTLGFSYTLTPNTGRNSHPPNTVEFRLQLQSGAKAYITGHSIGGGKILISKFNGFPVALRGDTPTLLMIYRDKPGMIWQVTKVIAERNINIATLTCSRKERGTEAFMNITLDASLSQEDIQAISAISDVFMVRFIGPVASGLPNPI